MAEEREASQFSCCETFSPLDGMKRDNLAALAKKVSVARCPPAACCSRRATPTSAPSGWSAGMVELREGERTVAMIRGGTAEARNPLHPQLPRTRHRARRR